MSSLKILRQTLLSATISLILTSCSQSSSRPADTSNDLDKCLSLVNSYTDSIAACSSIDEFRRLTHACSEQCDRFRDSDLTLSPEDIDTIRNAMLRHSLTRLSRESELSGVDLPTDSLDYEEISRMHNDRFDACHTLADVFALRP